ncbi:MULTISPECIES: PP2C family protein-serine/threonine phosphatase [unclassified Arthrobacter]|uniref:PP2C family protein-serine/threonine phosphatase n=1 Tax=unclassified Arthrobacter TaxID=235627 RepID=UPI002E010B5D|nr:MULTISPECIES: SpoIIE family protein phosphatase [unclassified Arthrobacter]MEC5190029.1 sigma-B regulation protein RsbU (phosphoserine phosphatase) [Arthrobacter sp. MP_M4]MEC5201497.1 sigma-B regulation protein RsbU (phosphoserine phosphatase) [Arthrobacter sp. MP_M7]
MAVTATHETVGTVTEDQPWLRHQIAIIGTGVDELSPLRKQLPFLLFFAVAAAMSSAIPTLTVSDWAALAAGAALTVAATGFAAVASKPGLARYAVLAPSLDFLAAGALRHGTGESHSIYASIVLLPVLWFAAMQGRRHVVYAAVGATVAIMIPFALGSSIDANPNELFRGLYSTMIFVLGALVVNELAQRARRRLHTAREQAATATAELSRAAEIQRFLLPKNAAPLSGYQTAGACIPSTAVGGDFFDWYLIEGGLGFTLGDVMGKGAGAGMIAATTRAVIRSARNSSDPATALTLMQDCLATDLSQAGSFATLFHARLRASDGRILFSDAGHGLTLVVRAAGTWERLASDNFPVGLLPDTRWESKETWLHPGDMIVSFSDGVLDLYDGTLAAVDEIGKLAVSAGSAEELVDAVRQLSLGTSNPDDVTVLAVRRETV